MHKKPIFLVLFALMTSPLFSDDFETNKFTPIQKFYYTLGQTSAKKEYYEKGYYQATEDFKQMLKKYKDRIKSLEAGKYLVESSKITYPEVYKTRTQDGGYKIHIESPTVEKNFSSDDLFIVPLLDGTLSTKSDLPKIKYANSADEEPYSDNFFIPSMSNPSSEVPIAPSEITDTVYVDIRHKSSVIREFLDGYGSKYSTTQEGYRVVFKNESEKIKFCTELTGEASCYGLN